MTKIPYCSVPMPTYHKARANLILLSEVGSTVYGTGLPGHEDHDEMGVSIMPPQDVLGTKPFEGLVWRTAGASEKSTPKDVDLAIYSARKYVTLAAAGNPSILVPLWTPDEKIFWINEAGMMLRDNRRLFVSKAAGYRFLGYMRAQRSRMEDAMAGTRAHRTNRPELIEKHGYDTKFAMHMLRLGVQGRELMIHGELLLPMEEATRHYLLAVRRGEVSYDQVLDMADAYRSTLEKVIEKSSWPEHPNYDTVNQLLVDLHNTHWESTA